MAQREKQLICTVKSILKDDSCDAERATSIIYVAEWLTHSTLRIERLFEFLFIENMIKFNFTSKSNLICNFHVIYLIYLIYHYLNGIGNCVLGQIKFQLKISPVVCEL